MSLLKKSIRNAIGLVGFEIHRLEVSFFETSKGGLLIDDCINFMKDHGFVAYDIFGLQYRLLDGAMSQIDVAFVQEKSKFRYDRN